MANHVFKKSHVLQPHQPELMLGMKTRSGQQGKQEVDSRENKKWKAGKTRSGKQGKQEVESRENKKWKAGNVLGVL